MNSIEMNELNEMREQLATLKKQLNTQEIINDRLIKEAMSRKLSALNNSAIWISVVCLVMIPLGYFNFQRMGHSTAFCIATSALFLICLIAIVVSHYRIHKRDIYSGNLVTVYKEVARMKKIYKSWHYWSIPMLIVWFGWLEYEIYLNQANEDITALLMISASGIFGGIIGGIVGLRIHKRTLRTADDLLRQIEELQRQE
ncbi:MAG: hypothetical protein E7140_02070 [Rikenellaceae bacterium]|nr:hypothetical protein [Rikenellaceae bacterium]